MEGSAPMSLTPTPGRSAGDFAPIVDHSFVSGTTSQNFMGQHAVAERLQLRRDIFPTSGCRGG